MKILHPDKTGTVQLKDLSSYCCNGVYDVIPAQQKSKLHYFLASFEMLRSEHKEKITDPILYDGLPFSINNKSWKSKQADARIVDDLCRNKSKLNILDVGAWNGWLSNYLSSKGHLVTATDIFTDSFDGLKANSHYVNDFISLQLLPTDLWRIEASFDLIIFNRNWAYIENKAVVFSDAVKLLSPNGKILFTGLTFYRNPVKIINQLADANRHFSSRFGISLLYFPTKGYLDIDDQQFLRKNARLYPLHFFRFWAKKLFSQMRLQQYAIYTKT